MTVIWHQTWCGSVLFFVFFSIALGVPSAPSSLLWCLVHGLERGEKVLYPFVRPLSGAPLPQLKRLGVLALTNLSQPNLTALRSPSPSVELGGAGSVPCALVSCLFLAGLVVVGRRRASGSSRRRVGSYSCVIGQPTPLIFLGVPDTGTHVPPPPSAYRLAGPPLEHRV